MRIAIIASLLSVAAFGLVTLYALEGNEVAVLRTRAQDGSLRTTRVWIADRDGSAWIEAASPRRPFYLDLAADPQTEVVRAGRVQRCKASLVPEPSGHRRIRRLLREKYGWADWWIGLLQDTSASRAVRMYPCDATDEPITPVAR